MKKKFLSSVLFKAHFNLSSLLFALPFTPTNHFLKILNPCLLYLISFKTDLYSKAFSVYHPFMLKKPCLKFPKSAT